MSAIVCRSPAIRMHLEMSSAAGFCEVVDSASLIPVQTYTSCRLVIYGLLSVKSQINSRADLVLPVIALNISSIDTKFLISCMVITALRLYQRYCMLFLMFLYHYQGLVQSVSNKDTFNTLVFWQTSPMNLLIASSANPSSFDNRSITNIRSSTASCSREGLCC